MKVFQHRIAGCFLADVFNAGYDESILLQLAYYLFGAGALRFVFDLNVNAGQYICRLRAGLNDFSMACFTSFGFAFAILSFISLSALVFLSNSSISFCLLFISVSSRSISFFHH